MPYVGLGIAAFMPFLHTLLNYKTGRNNMITTVLGEIPEEKMGVALSHEHILIDMRNCVDITGNEKSYFNDKISNIYK